MMRSVTVLHMRMTSIMMETKMKIQNNTLMEMKMMKKKLVMVVELKLKVYSKNLTTLKKTLEGILYSRGVKVRKFNWYHKPRGELILKNWN